MENFCDIALPSNISETILSFRLKEVSEAGHTMLRGRATKKKKEFELTWDSITSANKNTLDAFFELNDAEFFLWTHFESANVHTVLFVDEKLKFKYLSPGYWKLTFKIMEV